MLQWYCVYTQPQLELWARSNLWERGLDVYLPRLLKRRKHARRTDYVPRALFPRYLFVQAELEVCGTRAIRSARGVVDILSIGSGSAPTPVDGAIIEAIRRRENDKGYVELDEIGALKKGDRVRIVEGALFDHVGLFESVNDDRRVVILLDLLGRAVRARVAPQTIERER
ncbi:MAG: transcriptional activator RfaH [Proteobacteria bacterium]|nr:transcriptional activator RfaH [Pseudomonadota bacterium]